MTAATLGTCEFCDRPVTGAERAAYRVRGWELERKQGGANYIAGKERQPNRVCHALCVERIVRLDRNGLRHQLALTDGPD
jgi:hypothetical protein